VDWIHPWIGLGWIGLDWVEILEKNDGLDWIGLKVLCIQIFTAIFVRPMIYRYSILYRIFKHEYFLWITDDMTA